MTLVYTRIENQPVTAGNRDLVYWYGNMDFIRHFWRLLAVRGIEVLVTLQPRIECFRYKDNSAGRRKLAQDCYDRVLGRDTGEILKDPDDGVLLRGEAPGPALRS